MSATATRPPHRPKGSKTKHRLDGIHKKCRCRTWSKCGHPWHLSFKYNGHPYYYSLNRWAGKPTGYAMAQSEAERLRDKLRDLIRDGHAPGSRADLTPVAETQLTLDDIATRYEAYYAQQTWRGETRRAHRVPLLHQQLDLICRTRIPGAKNAMVRFGHKPIAEIVTGDIDGFVASHRAYMAAQEQARLDRRAKVAAGDMEAKKIPVSPARPRARGGEIGLNRHLGTLRALFNFAIRKGFYERANPFLLHGQSVVTFTKEQAWEQAFGDARPEHSAGRLFFERVRRLAAFRAAGTGTLPPIGHLNKESENQRKSVPRLSGVWPRSAAGNLPVDVFRIERGHGFVRGVGAMTLEALPSAPPAIARPGELIADSTRLIPDVPDARAARAARRTDELLILRDHAPSLDRFHVLHGRLPADASCTAPIERRHFGNAPVTARSAVRPHWVQVSRGLPCGRLHLGDQSTPARAA